MSKRCSVGIHDWQVNESEFESDFFDREQVFSQKYESNPTTRICNRCGIKQVKKIHCLGLNPANYTHDWNKVIF